MPICFQGALYPQSHVQIFPTCAFLSCSFGTTNRGGTPASAGRTKTSGFYDQIPVTTPMHRLAVLAMRRKKPKEWNHESQSLESIISILASVLPFAGGILLGLQVLDFAESWAHPELATRCS